MDLFFTNIYLHRIQGEERTAEDFLCRGRVKAFAVGLQF